MHTILDNKQEKKPNPGIRSGVWMHLYVRQQHKILQAALKASFIVCWQFPLAFTKHGEPFPELFGHARQRSV